MNPHTAEGDSYNAGSNNREGGDAFISHSPTQYLEMVQSQFGNLSSLCTIRNILNLPAGMVKDKWLESVHEVNIMMQQSDQASPSNPSIELLP
jgi:hypothetical protein